jgi:hypothetical protein
MARTFNDKYYTSVTLDLVGWWPLDDYQDRSGNNILLQPHQNPIPIGTNLSDRTATFFNGGSQYLNSASWPFWPTATQLAATVCFWNYVLSPSASSAFTVGNSSVDRFQSHAPYADGVIYWDYGSSRISASYSNYLGKWTHVCLSSDGVSTMFLYLNGILITSGSATHPSVNLTGIIIGAAPQIIATSATASMRDFRLYNRVLSPAEVLQIYAETFTPRSQKFWPGIDALGWKPKVALPTIKFRRTLSPVGTRIGARQIQGWSQ